jgi:regulator of protease activity HflC (stomatin/prohibitin superfamily)
LALTVITLPFASTVLLLAFFSYLLPPTPERRLLYNALVVVLGGLWVAIMALYTLRSISNLPPAPGGLVLERDTLQDMRREHALLRVGGPGKIVAPDSDAVVTEYNGRFYRVLSPGVQSLLPFEYVRAMIDLRQQEREGQAAGVTQDGITVRSRLAVTFRIHSDDLEPQGANVRGRSRQPTGRPPTREEPYPYSESAVYQAAYAESAGAQDKVSTWTQLPVAIAGGAFGRALAQTKLDQIFDPEARADAPHPLLLDRVGQATDERLDHLGIRLVTLRMERLRAPEPVDDVNVRGWRSHWETVQQMNESKERATAAREVERARTEAEVVMLQAIADAMEKARQGGSAALVQEIVALRLLEALERVARAAKKETEGGDDVLHRFGEMQRELAPPEPNT